VEAQTKLREELLTVGTDNPTMDELNALPYLDAIVRETLRIHAPVPASTRVAVQDDILPLSTPVMDNSGKMINSIKYVTPSCLLNISLMDCDGDRVVKGQTMLIPLLAMNRVKSIWGQDALEFK
jgi:hypothetical protein